MSRIVPVAILLIAGALFIFAVLPAGKDFAGILFTSAVALMVVALVSHLALRKNSAHPPHQHGHQD